MPKASSKSSVAVPVKIVGQPIRPVSSERIVIPAAPKQPTPRPAVAAKPLPTRRDVPERTRRRMMWAFVGVGAAVIIGTWLPLSLASQSNGGFSLSGLWHNVTTTFNTFSFKKQSATAAEKEIRALDSEVFPELSQ